MKSWEFSISPVFPQDSEGVKFASPRAKLGDQRANKIKQPGSGLNFILSQVFLIFWETIGILPQQSLLILPNSSILFPMFLAFGKDN
jgi:hypothetical protein